MVLYGAASAYLAYLIKLIFDDVLPAGRQLGFVAAAVAAAYFFKGAGAYFSAFLMTDVGERVVRDLRAQLFRHTLGQSAAFFARRSTGQLMSRITNDVTHIQRAVTETTGDLLRESLAVLGYAGLLLYYDARLALLCMTAAPVVVYPLLRLGQRVRRTTRRSQEDFERLSHLTAEAFTGHRIVKAFGGEGYEARRFGEAAQRLYRTNMKITSAVASLPPLMELLGGMAIVGALWYGSREIADGELTPGEFASFLAALFLMYGPVKKLSRVSANLQQCAAASQRVFEMLDTDTEVRDRPNARALEPLTRGIRFDHVCFGYADSDGRTILDDVTIDVKAGQMVAIVGLSGAGKSTLVNLIPRFYDVTAGAILVDGTDIRDVTLASLRQQIGMVTQETVLFDDTIANNIAYGSPHATPAQIEAAAQAAHAAEFIEPLPDGYQTRIGERGQRLSGGQRQRVAIARALVKNSPILVLDEATSALDAESELLVQDALGTLLMNRTAFVIAHRLSTVRRADAIVVLEEGRVVEYGRHDDLLERPDGVYARLYGLQLFEQPPAVARAGGAELAGRGLEP